MYKRFTAFTLAEVLITLGLIGVIAALTIPTLIENIQEKTTVTSLKKAYANLSNAYKLAVIDNGEPDEWGLVDAGGNIVPSKTISILAPYMKISKNCMDGSPGCFPAEEYKKLKNSSTNAFDSSLGWPKAQLADGTLIVVPNVTSTGGKSCMSVFGTSTALQHVCAEYWIDINGFNKPNQVGKDVFDIYLTSSGIIPAGTQAEEGGEDSFTDMCRNTGADGSGCAAWVLYNENMEYTKCNNTLSWGGATKCN